MAPTRRRLVLSPTRSVWLLFVLVALLILSSSVNASSADLNSLASPGIQKHSHSGAQPPLASTDDVTPHDAHGDAQRDESTAQDDFEQSEWPLNPLEQLHHALETMQSRYFELWLGQWPTAIDWTAAVMATFVSATLHSLTRSLEYIIAGSERWMKEGQRIENEISLYFSQVVAYYFGEDAFSLRMEAYDDMLWVVLGWLEATKFVNLHASRHYKSLGPDTNWYGRQFVDAFAHRAHIFYDLASEGWDTELCDGGMIWNPRLTPYKNAITNQLWISASVGMYLYFTGDSNTSPFMASGDLPYARPHDSKYLQAAVDGYAWLRSSNMTNALGLYVDGFHIHNWGKNGTIGTGKCDTRNEMVYTYNQGVILSGLRGLWEGTGNISYLEDAHELIRNVMNATGWRGTPPPRHYPDDPNPPHATPEWAGLGRGGVLEDLCDSRGNCSQDGQTFKGIFFHHLTTFCTPLPPEPLVPGLTYAASPAVASLHRQSCKLYSPWVAYNARRALKTRDDEGRFGTWWGAPGGGAGAENDGQPLTPWEDAFDVQFPVGAVDYRNNKTLLLQPDDNNSNGGSRGESIWISPLDAPSSYLPSSPSPLAGVRDANDRGRGRTVETQGGGVAVVRAMWEFVDMYKRES
ncbi:glycosyl hydrolase-like protein [Phyllosticta citriasiana]|uniref:Glycosyl hydrolase-like protein n=1 Tax=Phyllosticta citriasiana TaxID=595635 RepID=A0ABR1KG40_9PEZI